MNSNTGGHSFELKNTFRMNRKPAYKKPEVIRELERLANAETRRLHPTCPHLCPRKYRDDSANGLTQCIIAWLRLNGWQGERINCTGRPQDNTKIITDVLGDMRRVGSVKWLPTSGQRGTADISATIRGRSVKIEVKMKDKQSEDQVAYQQVVEKAGGLYWLVRSFEEFMNYYNELTGQTGKSSGANY